MRVVPAIFATVVLFLALPVPLPEPVAVKIVPILLSAAPIAVKEVLPGSVI